MADKKLHYKSLKKFCTQLGCELFGVADISGIKEEFVISEKLRAKLSSAICIGMRLSRAVLQDIDSSPTKLYFYHYKTVNAALDQAAVKAANFIQAKGFLALPVPASQIVDWEKQSAHLSHKKLGALAGLGWIGRNNLLVNKKLGSQFRLATILTDLPLAADKPAKENCGACRICVISCPAKAVKESALEFDHQACFAKLKEFQKQRLVDQYICGVCVNACSGKAGKK
jgi:epoxyqueuosine reductase QueG